MGGEDEMDDRYGRAGRVSLYSIFAFVIITLITLLYSTVRTCAYLLRRVPTIQYNTDALANA
mgnify:CR=1 FL=1